MKHTVLIKYLFSILLIVIGFVLYKNIFVASFALIELLIIFLISNFLVNKNKVIGLIVNSIMMVLLNTNLIIYIFSHSYLSYFMVSNVTSVRALGTKLCIYIPCLLVTLMLTLLPIKPIKRIKSFWVLIIIPIYVILLINLNSNNSSIGNYITLAKIYYDDFAMKIRIKKMHLDNNLFLQYSVSDYVKYDNSLGEQPNILLLFVEGMSSNNVEDKKNIMPNTKNIWKNH